MKLPAACNTISFFSLLFFSANIFSQAPEIIWERGFGGNIDDRAFEVIEAPDGGFLTIGHSNSSDGDITDNHGATDYVVVKTDSAGNPLWIQNYGGSSYDYGYSIINAVNGGYMMIGYTPSADGDISSHIGGDDFWVVKIDESGNIEWEKNYGGTDLEYFPSIIRTSDDMYVISGCTTSSDGDITENFGNSDMWILKIDTLGNIIWETSYGTDDYDEAHDVIETTDAGFIVSGSVGGWDNTDYCIIKLNDEGELVWDSILGGSDSETAYSVVQKSDGGFLCAGYTFSDDGDVSENFGYYDVWVVVLDSLGNLEWEKNYGGTGFEEAKSVTMISISDNEFVFSGRTSSDNIDVTENKGLNDYWIVCIDSLGEILWEKSIGGSGTETSLSIIKTTDGSLVTAGWSGSNDGDVTETYLINNYWVVKLGWCSTVFYADADGDGYGDITADSTACNVPAGFVSDSTDCNDADSLIYPFALDICNAIDDNCNGLTDEDAVFVLYFADADGDSYGDETNDSLACSLLTGYVTDSTDCNDADFYIHPDTKETCNFLDDNCNTEIDEGIIYFLLYADADGDDFGDAETGSLFCELTEGFTTDSTDCDDTNSTIYPGAAEITDNGTDEDCDGKDLITSLSEIEETIFSIFPNPTEGNIIITSSLANYTNTLFEISNLTGEKIFTVSLTATVQMADISQLAAGNYIIRIKQDEKLLHSEGLVLVK